MKHSIEVSDKSQWVEREATYTAVVYPNETNRMWDIVIERWVAQPYEGTTVYPQEQVYRQRIPNTGADGIVEHLEELGWVVPPMTEWATAFHNAVQSAYTIELDSAPKFPEIYQRRPAAQRWLIRECLIRGVCPDFSVQMIDSGVRTVEEVFAAFDVERIARAVL